MCTNITNLILTNFLPFLPLQTPEWFVATPESMPVQQPMLASPGMSQTRSEVATSLGGHNRNTTSARPRLVLGEPGVGSTPPTAKMTERFITNVSTELHTPDIKLEHMLGDTPLQYSSDSNKLLGSLSGPGECEEAVMAGGGGHVAPSSSHHFPSFLNTQYVDMSPSAFDTLTQDSDLGATVDTEAVDQNLENDIGTTVEVEACGQNMENNLFSDIPQELYDLVDNILPDLSTQDWLNYSGNVDSGLMESDSTLMVSDAMSSGSYNQQGLMETESKTMLSDTLYSGASNQQPLFSSPINNNAMISYSYEQVYPSTAGIARPPSPPTISMTDDFELPQEMQEVFETFNKSMPLANEPFDNYEDQHLDQQLVAEDGPLLPTNTKDRDILHQILQQCSINPQETIQEGEQLLLDEGGVTYFTTNQSGLPPVGPSIFLPAPSMVIPATAPIKTIKPNETQLKVVSNVEFVTDSTLSSSTLRPSTLFSQNSNETQSVVDQSVKVKTDSRLSSNLRPSTHISQGGTSVVPLLDQKDVSNVGPLRARQRRAIRKPYRLRDDDVILLDDDVSIHPITDPVPSYDTPSVPSTSNSSVNLKSSYKEEIPSTSSGRQQGCRQPARGLTDEEKYRRTRKLNNLASKRCRDKRKGKLSELEVEEQQLREVNEDLKQKVAVLTARKEKMKALMEKVFTKSVQARYGNR